MGVTMMDLHPAPDADAAALRRANLHQRQLKWKQLSGLEQLVTEGSFTEVRRLDSFDGGGGGGGGDGGGGAAVPVCTSAMGDSDARTDSINDAGAGTQAVPVCTMCRNESGVGKRACQCDQPIAASNADSPSQNQRIRRTMLRKQLVCSASSTQLSDTDLQSICSVMDGLGIAVQVLPCKITSRFVMFEGKFRGGTVVVKIGRELDATPQNNAAMREVLARDGKLGEFGLQLFAQLLPFNEKHAIAEGIPELDVLQIQISRGKAYAVIEEPHKYRAEVVFDALAERWREKPSEETVRDTAGLLLAVITLLSALHSRGRAYGGDPRTFKLSMLKDGYGRQALAFVLYNGQTYSLLLGDAEHLMDPLTVSDHDQQRRTAKRSRGAEAVSRIFCPTAAVRQSIRKVGSNASIPFNQIESMLMNPQDPASSHSKTKIEEAKRDDVRKAAMAVVNAIFGKEVHETKGPSHLFRAWLDTLPEEEFRNVTGLHRLERDPDCEGFCNRLMHKTPLLKDLFELIDCMLKGEAFDAQKILASSPFPGMAVPSDAYPVGLDSAPDVARSDLEKCSKLMQQIQQNVLHYYVAGKTLSWRNEQKRLIPTWLVFKWDEEKQRFNRSLWTAAEGEPGDLGAIYHARVLKDNDAALIAFISPVHLLLFPTSKTTMDGRPRLSDDVHKAVERSEVAQFVNSSVNERGSISRHPNCARDWNRDWTALENPRSLETIDDAAMGLKLLRPVVMYEELHYSYPWGKYDKPPDKAVDPLALLTMEPSNGRRR
jgi:hypothetical protein